MPSNVELNPGTAGAIAATKQITHDGDTAQVQMVGLFGLTGSEDAYVAGMISGDTVFGLDVDVSRVTPGTTATALGKAEDAAHASGDVGVLVLGVRRDTVAVGADTDGDNATFNFSASGRLWTSATIDAALPTGGNTIGNVGVAGGSVGLLAGTANIGDVDIASIAAGDNNIGNVDVVTMPNVTLAAGTNTNEVVGDAAHDAAIAGNPIRIAGRALTSDYTAVAAGDTADLITTLLGKLVTIPYANPANTWSYAAASGGITDTTGVTAKTAAGAGVRNYITRLQVINGHATVSTDVQIRDGAAGTVLWRGFAQAAGGGVAAVFDPPLRGTANTLIEVACGTTGSATYFNVQGYAAAE